MPATQDRNARPSLSHQRLVTGACLLALLSLTACQRGDSAATARDYIAKGDYTSASVHLRGAVQAHPESAELRVLFADALERKYDLVGVEQHLVKALELGGDENLLIPRIALVMLDRNQLEPLINQYRERRLSDPAADSSLRGTVAIAMLGLKRTGHAQTQVQTSTPSHALRLANAQLLVAEGKPGAALEELDLDGAGKDAPWWVLRAAKRIATAMGDQNKALGYMKRALDLAPWHGGVAGEYGEALISANRADDAVTVRDKLRKDHPGLFWTHYVNALLLHRAGRVEEGHAAALRALRGSPDHVPTTLIAASTELQKGDLLMAEKRLQSLLRTQADSVPALQLAAQVQARMGHGKEAAVLVDRGLQLAPNDPTLLGMRADFQMADGKFKPALATLTALLAARPDEPDAMLRLAQAHFRADQKGQAMALLEKAASLGAADPILMSRLVAVALRMNNPALARQAADLSLARQPDNEQARLTLAAVQSAQKDSAAAWATTLSVLDKKPASSNALSALAAMSRTPAQRKELLSRLALALDAKPDSPRVFLDYAALLRFEAGATTPLTVLEKGVQTLPTSVPLREALVDEHLRLGAGDLAIGAAQSGAAMANATPEAGALLARTYDKLSRFSHAADAYRKLASENPQRADWRLRLAQLDTAERPVDARAQLRALITERPFDLNPYLALAQLEARENVKDALAVANQLKGSAEFKSAGMLLEGDILHGAGRNGEALEAFARAGKAGAEPAATLRAVALLGATGDSAGADRELEALLGRFPADPRVVSVVASRAQARGDAARAVTLLQQVAARVPNDPYVLNDLAWAQLAAGRPEALGNARKAAAALPNSPTTLHTLGLSLDRAGKKDDAIVALRAAANLAPLQPMPRLHLAQRLSASGDKVGAAEALRTIKAEGLNAADRASLAKLKEELGMS